MVHLPAIVMKVGIEMYTAHSHIGSVVYYGNHESAPVEELLMDESAIQAVLATMVAAKLYGHDLRLRALGRDGSKSRVKLWCVRCFVSREFTCEAGGADGRDPKWEKTCEHTLASAASLSLGETP